MQKVVLKKQAAQRLKKGSPLIKTEDLAETAGQTVGWAEFIDSRGTFLGRGYLGQQNKGAGWLISQERVQLDHAYFSQLFQEAKERRQHFFGSELTTAFRIFNGEGDGLGGLTIDWYQQYAVFSWYNQAIYHYAPMLLQAFQAVYPEVLGASEKIRFAGGLPESRWLYGEEPQEALVVQENGVNYAVYLNEGLMTGIFLDQKDVRDQLVQGLAAGKSVLNLFSYTGAFSVAAAMGGAATTTSVDLAKRSRQKTEEQFAVNDLSLENQRIIVMDTFEYFKYAQRKGLQYDVIILDPPSFARNKKKTFTVAKNYGELVADALKLLSRGGQLIASTNAANVSLAKFKELIEKEFVQAGVGFAEEAVYRLPADFQTAAAFPEGNYLKVVFYRLK